MKKSLSSFELSCIVKELQPLGRGIIDFIGMSDKKELFMGIHIAGTGKTYVRLIAGKAAFIVSEKKTAEKLSGFCAFLRKHLDQARISSITQPFGERIIRFMCAAKEGELTLLVELFGKGNIMLVKEDVILGCAELQQWKDRAIRPGEKYRVTEKESFSEALEHLTAESLVKSLAVDCGLGGIYAEELCKRVDVNKNTVPSAVTSAMHKKLVAAWDALQKESVMGYCIYKENSVVDVTPIRLHTYTGCETKEFPTYSEALAFAYSLGEESAGQAELRKKREKLMTITQQQEANIVTWEKEREDAAKTAEWIYHHYQDVQNLLLQVREAFEKKNPMPKEVKEVKRKEKKVIVELE